MKWFKLAIQNYTVIQGRTSREGYWMFILFSVLLSMAAVILDFALGTRFGDNGLIQTLLSLFLLVPGTTIVVRRLHDIGKSGKWYMWFLIINAIIFFFYFFFLMAGALAGSITAMAGVGLILAAHCLVAGIIFLIPMCTRGTPGVNKYGPNPEEITPEYTETTEEM
jgi:uncharacterized membrane protein YhaH (DUF805 family)